MTPIIATVGGMVLLVVGAERVVTDGSTVGTNLVNILFVLGLAAVLSPLVFQSRVRRFDLPAVVGASALLYVLVPGLPGLAARHASVTAAPRRVSGAGPSRRRTAPARR